MEKYPAHPKTSEANSPTTFLESLPRKELQKISNALLRCIMSADNVGLIICDLDGTITDTNEGILNLLQYTREDLKAGRVNWRDITPKEYEEVDNTALVHLRAKGIFSPYEKQYFRRDGSRADVLVMPAMIEDSESIDAIGLIVDLSALKNAEKALAETNRTLDQRVRERSAEVQSANAFLDSLIEHIPSMIFVKEAKKLRYVRFNRASEELMGYSRQEMLGKGDYDFFPEKEADYLIETDREVFAKGKMVEIQELPTTTKYRGVRILHTKKIPLYDEHGEPQYLLGISEDITERKIAEAERLELIKAQTAKEEAEKIAEQFKILSKASALFTSSLDYQSTLQNLVRAIVPSIADWCAINAIGAEGDFKLLALEYIHNDQNDPWHLGEFYPIPSTMKFGPPEVLRTGKTMLLQPVTKDHLTEYAKDSRARAMLENIGILSHLCVPLKSRSEIFGTISFITTRESGRLYDASDVQLAEDLASRASLAIDNARLYETSQNLNRVKDEFLATLSHELRTPLNVIQGLAEILKAEDVELSEDDRRDYYEAIWRNSQNQTRIMTDLLDLSAIITGKMSFTPQIISAGDAVRDVIKNFTTAARMKGVSFESDLFGAPPSMMADLTRFQQIVWNLVSNAIKFTPAGGSVKVSVTEKGSACILEVTDTGIGIEPEFISHIFERFRQEDSTVTRRFGGLGLGLSIVRQLVELHGGEVFVESEGKGRGAKFIVALPLSLSPKIVS